MKRRTVLILILLTSLVGSSLARADNPRVNIVVADLGTIEVELLATLAPETVKNFLDLVDQQFYDGLIFHRVIANFMIQTGGYQPDLEFREASATVVNESYNGVKNRRGTLAMARTDDPDSASSEFFINVADNPSLDLQGDQAGYTVFGRVVSGMEVVDQIEVVNTHLRSFHAALPEEPVIITTIERIDTPD